MTGLARRLDRIEQRIRAAEPPPMTIEDYRESWRQLERAYGSDPPEPPPEDWTLEDWREWDRQEWAELDRIYSEGADRVEPSQPA